MRYAPRERSRLLPVEITSMVDVVFLLIIFFMTTAKVAREERMKLDLPQEVGQGVLDTEESGLIINIGADGGIVVAGSEVELGDLGRVVRREIARRYGGDAAMLRLTIRADREGSTARLNEVVRSLRELGVGGAQVATEVPTARGGRR